MTDRALIRLEPRCPKCGEPLVYVSTDTSLGTAGFVSAKTVLVPAMCARCLWRGEAIFWQRQESPEETTERLYRVLIASWGAPYTFQQPPAPCKHEWEPTPGALNITRCVKCGARHD